VHWNWLDILLGVILLLSVLAGLKDGLARAGIGFLAAIAAIVCAMWFYPNAAYFVHKVIHSAAAANVIGFLLVFAAVIGVGGVIALLVEKVFKVVHLSWLNRLLGGAFGVVRGVLICGAIVLLFLAFSGKEPPQLVRHSRIAPYVIHATRAMAYAAPREIREGFEQSYKKLKQIWADLLREKPERPSPEVL
jgi:membrane protein required for colicin V production